MEEELPRIIMAKGSGSSGHLLNSTLSDEAQFIPLNLGFIVGEIAISSTFTLALSKGGQLYLWGFLKQAQVERPLRVMSKVEKISCGWEHALFTANDQLYGFGSNAYQQLGIQTSETWQKEILLLSDKKASFIKAGFRQSYAIFQQQLWGCGESKKYQLAKLSKNSSLWGKVAALDNIQGQIIRVQCGKRFLLLLDSLSRVYALGFNEGNCFNSQNEYFVEPTLIFHSVRAVACGWSHIILLRQQGRVESYGKNNLGQAGHPNKDSASIDFDLAEGQQIEQIYSGTQFSFARSSKGRLFGWGWNEHRNIAELQQIISTPVEVKVTGKCFGLWTHIATTFIQTSK